jgi:transcriptional regulator with XRE-family HTH domain
MKEQTGYHFRLRAELGRHLAQRNISQNGLARACRLSSGHMSQLLKGTRLPGPQTRQRLMEFLRLPFEELFEEVAR